MTTSVFTAKRVGAMVRASRQRLGLSLREAAEAIECSHVFLEAIEGGRSAVPVARCRRIASALDMNFDELRMHAREAEGVAALAKVRARWEAA